MDQDATWYGGMATAQATLCQMRPMSIVANGRPCQLLLSFRVCFVLWCFSIYWSTTSFVMLGLG